MAGPGKAASLAGLRYTKRRTEYLLRRLVTKHAVAAVIGRPADPATLAGIEVRNVASGAPYVYADGAPLAVEVSITDRAGWAVCATSPRDASVGSGRNPLQTNVSPSGQLGEPYREVHVRPQPHELELPSS